MSKKEEKKGANNKSAAQAAAAAQQAPKVENTKPEVVEIVSPKKISTMTQSDKIAYGTLVQRRKEELMQSEDPSARSLVDGFNIIVDATIIDVAVTEIAAGNSATGLIISRNENNYNRFAVVAAKMGVNLPSFKSLPSPTKEQLAQAGLSGIEAGQAALIIIDDKAVSKDAKKKKKNEIAIAKKEHLDPTKIETPEQLKEQLTMCFLGNETPVLRIQNAINFYNTYLTFKAKKAENSEEELEKVKEMSRIQQLREIVTIVGDCTFAMTGIAHFLNVATNETKTPVSAFCMFKRATERAGERAKMDDNAIADMVKILVIWSCESEIAKLRGLIDACDVNLKELGKDKKANAAAIKTEQTFKTNHESEIKGFESIIACVNNPSFDIVDNLIANYDADPDSQAYAIAHRIVSNIMETYNKDLKIEEVDKDSMLKNVQQRAGVIVNMFASPLAQSIAYAESNIGEIQKKNTSEEATEEKAEEEGEASKN